jgi:hypothetical protein
MSLIDFGIDMDYETEQKLEKQYEVDQKIEQLKNGEKLVTTHQIKKPDKKPPYILVGNGKSTKAFPEDVTVDAFLVFSELTKAQQQLFIDLKDVLVQERLSHYATRIPDNPNLIFLDDHESNEFHQSIRARMGQNRNGTTLEEKGVLKKMKVGKYMFNPYLFPPPGDFKRIADLWNELPTKSSSPPLN